MLKIATVKMAGAAVVALLVGTVVLVPGFACSSDAGAGRTVDAKSAAVVRDGNGDVVSESTFLPQARREVLQLRRSGPFILTDAVSINGSRVGPFVVDTGANASAIDPSEAVKLGLNGSIRMAATEGEVPMYRVAAFSLGELSIRNHAIRTADMSSVNKGLSVPVGGVLGGDIWSRVPFTIDYSRNTLTLWSGDRFKAPASAVGYPLKIRDRLKPTSLFNRASPLAGNPVVNVKLDNIKTEAMLDTGSSSPLVLMPMFVQQHKNVVLDWRVMVRAEGLERGMQGAGGMPTNVASLQLLGARFGVDNSVLAISGEQPEGEQLFAVVGAPVLSKFRLTFDYAGGMLWCEAAETKPR